MKTILWGLACAGVTSSVILGNILADHMQNQFVGDVISIFLILCIGGALFASSADLWIWSDDDKSK